MVALPNLITDPRSPIPSSKVVMPLLSLVGPGQLDSDEFECFLQVSAELGRRAGRRSSRRLGRSTPFVSVYKIGGGIVHGRVECELQFAQMIVPRPMPVYILRDHCFYRAICALDGITLGRVRGREAVFYVQVAECVR